MTNAFPIAPSYPVFTGRDGTPLEAGYIYIGTAGQNPETSEIPVFWDDGLTIPAAQPIRTIGGYPARNGSPAAIFTAGDFSITVREKDRTLVYSTMNGAYPGWIYDALSALRGWTGQAFDADGRSGPYPVNYMPDDQSSILLLLDGVPQEFPRDYVFEAMPSAPSGWGVRIIADPIITAPVRIRLLYTRKMDDVGPQSASISMPRAEMAARIVGGFEPLNGYTYLLDGLSYLGQTSATEISDLPGLVPVGDAMPGHYGLSDFLADLPAAWVQAARDWVADLKGAGVWDKLDAAWLPCLGESAGRRNWKNFARYQLGNPSGVEWIDGFGVWAAGDTWIDTGFNPTTAGLADDDWHFSAYMPNNIDRVRVFERSGLPRQTWGSGGNTRPVMGSPDGRWRLAPMGDDQGLRVATGAAGQYANIGAVLSVQQHVGQATVSSNGTVLTGYKNGVNLGATAVSEAYLPNENLQLLGAGISPSLNPAYYSHPVAVATVGRALTDAEASALAGATQALMLAIGADMPVITPKRVEKTKPVNPVTGPARVVDFRLGVGLDHVTYTRTGATTVIGRSGFYETVAENVEPIAYDPISRVPLGLQTYGGFTNREARSQEFDHADYVKDGVAITDATGVYGLDGTTTDVFVMTADGASGEHSISRTYTGLARYICAQIWLKEPVALARSSELIALRIRTKDDVENWAVLNKANRRVVTFGANITTPITGQPRAGYSETWDERTELYLAVDTTTATDVDVRVSLVVIDPSYPMDGTDPAAYAINEAEDVTNLLGWQIVDSADNYGNYPRPYIKTTGSTVTVGDHQTSIDLTGLDTSKDLFFVFRAKNTFTAQVNSYLCHAYNGSSRVLLIARTNSGEPARLNMNWLPGTGTNAFVEFADAIPDGGFLTCVAGRSIQMDKQYRASNDRTYEDFSRTGWTGGAPDTLYIGNGGLLGARQAAFIFERVEIWTSRPTVAEIQSRVHFDGGTYGPAPFVDLEDYGFAGVWQPWLGMRPTAAGTQPVIERMLASAYNTAGSVLTGSDQVAYCAGGANLALQGVGISLPVNLWASSFSIAGPEIGLDPDDWQKWDVLLLRRNDGDGTADRVGHVTFLLDVVTGDSGTYAITLGANQNNNQIGVAAYPISDVFSVHRLTEEYAQ